MMIVNGNVITKLTRQMKKYFVFLACIYFSFHFFCSNAQDLKFLGGSEQLVFYCKGIISEKEGVLFVEIKEYKGDFDKASKAAKQFEERLNSPIFGPNRDNKKVFFLCALEKKTNQDSIQFLGFGSFAKHFKDKFVISGQSSKEGYFLSEIELAIFRTTLIKLKQDAGIK